MNKSAFLKLIQQASNITDQQQNELEQVAAAFPYCQTAHLLLAKSAYDKGSMLSTQRLRRASSYATDRQLLKRIIYTSPILETVAIADEPIEEQDDEAVLTNDHLSAHDTDNIQEVDTAVTVGETRAEEMSDQEETLEEVYTPTVSLPEPYLTDIEDVVEEENPEAEIDSELALLFTFNSISSSSTDLLSERELEETSTDQLEQETEVGHFAETAEALDEIEESEGETIDVADIETVEAFSEEPMPEQVTEKALAIPEETAILPPTSESELFEEEEEQPVIKPEDAEINYSFDEIDRLYAEDALGYAMGSSRMGEVLQLKDDYTRPRPQSFHPELILEYSKTHELEKAIQPTANVLSHQLNIIDQFLKLNPRLKTMASVKLKPEPQEDLSLKSSKIKKGMASESLASIFLKQGKTKKALKIYEQLILKYPEKKSYFAEQIEKLQNIT
ncbi:tetratricopeptide repeat protein [uncultured Pontibacter sp.]|uniref:tetratricopeptide repeat protein n=1 Tax=uncultured Pontibacter sp. TaxID=453356 RepID=UPI00262E620D|nr:tetratricopeptide repeat protein [uncultured Pontibacter sp.]